MAQGRAANVSYRKQLTYMCRALGVPVDSVVLAGKALAPTSNPGAGCSDIFSEACHSKQACNSILCQDYRSKSPVPMWRIIELVLLSVKTSLCNETQVGVKPSAVVFGSTSPV